MFNPRKIVVQLKVNLPNGNPVKAIDSLFSNTVKPDLVFLNMSSIEYPNKILDIQKDLVNYVVKNPKVKFIWDGKNPFDEDDAYEILDAGDGQGLTNDFIEKNMTFKLHEYIDMTMVSVFYDAGINELRKVATKKAVSHWIEQYHLPDEMFFVELGFNGVFTFSEEDFPKEIQYVRIDGNDSNKYLFQKEHLWNIMAKRAKNEKLMFLDSDIAPLENVDWFKQAYEALDTCLFTQGFRSITYLDENDVPNKKTRNTYTTQILENGSVSGAVPGGAYCITKTTLQIMGYFNYLPFGGGDNVFWSELINSMRSHYPWFVICKRDSVPTCMNTLMKLEHKELIRQVYVDVCHFFHGKTRQRSYRQRHYMMMTQFPWMDRIITEDEQGLLSWVDTNHYFYYVMSQLQNVNDNKMIAASLLDDHIDYLGFVKEFERNMGTFEKMKDDKQARFAVVDMVSKWISRYSKDKEVNLK